MRAAGLGHVLFAGSLAGLGVLSLLSGDFALTWQPVPEWIPWREHLARASGLLLLAAGLGTFLKRWASLSALVLTIDVSLWVLLLQIPRVATQPTNESMWLGLSENLVLAAGGWIVFAALTPPGRSVSGQVAGEGSLRIARFLFAAALPIIGLSHFVYGQATAALVPTWLPNRIGIAYLTGIAHIAAGLGLMVAVLPRLAATLEALMITSFTLLVWLPRVAGAPANRGPWTALLVSAALTGAAWAVAASSNSSARMNRQKRAHAASAGAADDCTRLRDTRTEAD